MTAMYELYLSPAELRSLFGADEVAVHKDGLKIGFESLTSAQELAVTRDVASTIRKQLLSEVRTTVAAVTRYDPADATHDAEYYRLESRNDTLDLVLEALDKMVEA